MMIIIKKGVMFWNLVQSTNKASFSGNVMTASLFVYLSVCLCNISNNEGCIIKYLQLQKIKSHSLLS